MKKKMILAATSLTLILALATGCTASAADIGRDAALEAAFNDAGITEAQAARVQISEDTDDGRKTYDIRFDVDGTEYDYEVLASDGKILSADTEALENSTQTSAPEETPSVQEPAEATASEPQAADAASAQNDTAGQSGSSDGTLSRETAVQTVLDQVPGATEDTLFLELERDDGRYKYEGTLIYGHTEYDFELDAETGSVLQWEEKSERNANATVALSREQAIQTVLDQVPGAVEDGLFLELERDDGKYKYEGTLIYQQVEYDFELDADTGSILEWTQERAKEDSGASSEVTLSQAEAIQIALDRVPGATEQNIRIELDYDDGQYKYEGEILYQQREYDFEIDANSGTILEWSEERA